MKSSLLSPGSSAASSNLAVTAIVMTLAACQLPATTGNDNMASSSASQVHAWQCDDGTRIRSHNRPSAIELHIGTDISTLARMPTASGAHYENAAMTFWTKGHNAMLERRPGAPVMCRLERTGP